jgi:hypothetical protein
MQLPDPRSHSDSPVRPIAQHGHHSRTLALPLGQLGRRPDVQSRRRADVQTLLVEQTVDHVDGSRVGHVQCAGEEVDVGLEVGGDPALSDACGVSVDLDEELQPPEVPIPERDHSTIVLEPHRADAEP